MGERLDAPAAQMEAKVLSWAAELEAADPSFLYLHLNDPHDPLDRREPWYASPRDGGDEGAEDRARYDSEIGYLDAALARLHERLGWGEDTLLVVVSDHGEEFWEHGRRGHGTSLYGEQNRVLMMIHAPGLVAPGRRVEENVSLIDVTPTVLDLVGAPPVPGASGLTLVPLLRPRPDPAAFADRTLFAHWVNPAPVPEAVDEVPDTAHIWAVLRQGWRLVRSDDRTELYDDVADPGNRTDLAATRADVTEGLLAELAAFEERVASIEHETVEVEIDAKAAAALEKLGYGGGE
jgi:arylsulfatase A-like enzyme